ncbi:MAG TPA: DoxX family protein [Polyangiaceae bacterium]
MTSRVALWTGRVVSALPALALVLSASMKLAHSPELTGEIVGKLGYPDPAIARLGVLELVCAVLYAIPQTSFVGALLVTGYLGGAIASHVRVGESFAAPLVLGVLVWVGLYLRESRLRALAPIRTAIKPQSEAT